MPCALTSSTGNEPSISARSRPARSWRSSSCKVDSDGVYYPRLYTAQEAGIAELSLESGGKALPIVARPKPHVLQLGGLFLTQGEHPMSLVAATAGRAIFDCLQLEPAARFSEAIEAEELTVVRATGGAAAPRPSEPMAGVSAGRVLEFHADKAGQGFVLNLGKRPSPALRAGGSPDDGTQRGHHSGLRRGPSRSAPSSIFTPPSVSSGRPFCRWVRCQPARPRSRSGSWAATSSRRDGTSSWIISAGNRAILGPGTAEGVWAQVVGHTRLRVSAAGPGAGLLGRAPVLGATLQPERAGWTSPSRFRAPAPTSSW